MKKILFLLTILYSINLYSQSDSAYFYKITDDMKEKVYYMPSYKFIIANEDKTKGFTISIHCINNSLTFGFLAVTTVNIGSCNEDNQLIILFDNGQKITLKSWNEFNCKGDSYFNVTKSQEQLLASYTIKKVMFENGFTFDSFTGEPDTGDKRYFIQLFYGIEHNLSKVLTQ